MSTSNRNDASSSSSFSANNNAPCNTNPEIHHMNAMDQVFDDEEKISNLSYLVGLELDYLEKSFQDAKSAMDRVFDQMKEARIEFSDLQMILQMLESTRGGGKSKPEMDNILLRPLQALKVKVSNLKTKIPFNLILPSKSEIFTSNPHIYWRPRNYRPRPLEVPPPPPPSHRIPTFENLQDLDWSERSYLHCLGVFPEKYIIKKSLLLGLLQSCTFDLAKAEELLDKLAEEGLIKPVYKKGNMVVSGYWVHPLIRSAIRDKLIWSVDDYIHITLNIEEEDVIYDDPIQFPDHTRLRVLHLGKWQKPSTYHAEVIDPDFFFKDVPSIVELRYLSLRGISMIKELPKCITQLRYLHKLDLKACHNLVVIPSEIANLRENLTCLDMSECYFLENMPMALAQLRHLTVLKGFFIGKTKKKETCTLKDLVVLRELVKLNIYTDDRGFPNESDLATLQEFKSLRNLTISWGGCSNSNATTDGSGLATDAHQQVVKHHGDREKKFDFNLEKLDLQCVPTTVVYSWLRPDNFKTLERLYIRGGKLHDLGQQQKNKTSQGSYIAKEDQWSVRLLCLKYLKNLSMDLHELETMFPRLIYLEKVECPNLVYYPRPSDGNAV